MKDKFELPPELAHLIEKREQDDRRAGASSPPIVDSPIADEAPSKAPEQGERRRGVDRRTS